MASGFFIGQCRCWQSHHHRRKFCWTRAVTNSVTRSGAVWPCRLAVPGTSWTKLSSVSTQPKDGHNNTSFIGSCCWSVSKSCPTECDPMNCRTPGFLVRHCLREFAQTHVHWVNDAIQPSHPLHLFSCPQSFWASGCFPVSQLFSSSGQSIGASASASVLPVNIQGWFPLGLTGLISLQSKGLSRVFSNTTAQKHQFFGAQLSI